MEVPRKLIPGEDNTWDQRFTVKTDWPDLFIGKLGAGGLKQFEEMTGLKRQNHPVLNKIPAPVRPTLPAFWQGKTLISVPCLEVENANQPIGKIRFSPPEPFIRSSLTFN